MGVPESLFKLQKRFRRYCHFEALPAGNRRISLLATSIIYEAISPKTHELETVSLLNLSTVRGNDRLGISLCRYQ